ncbi:hypothetical protein DL96DRAFT_1586404 [Flagelloscypha sp. PMI_526]|nr:hypothetical protein DL96DRAFT_1586404 [Flagelloscypha sp. PMI_526]
MRRNWQRVLKCRKKYISRRARVLCISYIVFSLVVHGVRAEIKQVLMIEKRWKRHGEILFKVHSRPTREALELSVLDLPVHREVGIKGSRKGRQCRWRCGWQ